MSIRFLICLVLAGILATGCATSGKKPGKPASRASDMTFKKLEVAGVRLGDGKGVLRKFGTAKRSALSGGGREVYEIYKPNSYISMLVLTFVDGRVKKMELRYFKGPTEHTYVTAGGWEGLRDYLIKRFGPPTKTGDGVTQLNDMRGLTTGYAKFNGEWLFPKAEKRIHFISLADARGGVAVITFLDTSTRKITPAGQVAPPGSIGFNPGF